MGSILYRARLRWLGRNEYESRPLRRWFAREFDTEVGLYSYGCFDRWRFPPPVRIGRYCSFAKTALVVEANHPLEALSSHPFLYDPRLGVTDRPIVPPRPLVVEDDVWVGHNATILPGCRFIGRGAILAAGAVVTADVPAYAVMAGVPARLLRMRFDARTIAGLEASRWWELDRAGLARLMRTAPEIMLHAGSVRPGQGTLQELVDHAR